jgi:hypothetical protein
VDLKSIPEAGDPQEDHQRAEVYAGSPVFLLLVVQEDPSGFKQTLGFQPTQLIQADSWFKRFLVEECKTVCPGESDVDDFPVRFSSANAN